MSGSTDARLALELLVDEFQLWNSDGVLIKRFNPTYQNIISIGCGSFSMKPWTSSTPVPPQF